MAERIKALCAAVVLAAVFVGATASGVLAGEVTGSGKNQDQNQGKSWCSFSGLNDKVEGEGPVEPMAQSYGQDVKLGTANPREANPGFFCNPNRTPLPPNPNRTK